MVYKSGAPVYLKYENQQAIDLDRINGFEDGKTISVALEDLLAGTYVRFPSFKEVNIQFSYTKPKKWGMYIWDLGVKNLFYNKNYKRYTLGGTDNNYKVVFNWTSPEFFNEFYPYLSLKIKIK